MSRNANSKVNLAAKTSDLSKIQASVRRVFQVAAVTMNNCIMLAPVRPIEGVWRLICKRVMANWGRDVQLRLSGRLETDSTFRCGRSMSIFDNGIVGCMRNENVISQQGSRNKMNMIRGSFEFSLGPEQKRKASTEVVEVLMFR